MLASQLGDAFGVSLELRSRQLELLQALDLVQLRKGLRVEDHLPLPAGAHPFLCPHLLLQHDVDGYLVYLDSGAGASCDVEYSAPAYRYCWPTSASTFAALHRTDFVLLFAWAVNQVALL